MQKRKFKKSDSFTKTFIRQNIKENKRLLIILIVLQFLGIPVYLITLSYIDHPVCGMYLDLICLISFISFTAASVLGIYIALKSFLYLSRKTQADKIQALPLSTKQRFIGSYLSGLITYIVPYIASIVVSTIIFAFILNRDGYGLSLSAFIEYGTVLIQFELIWLFAMIMLYTTTVFTCSCCGNILESIVYTVFLNVGIPLFVYIFSVIAYDNIPSFTPRDELQNSLPLSGPIGTLWKVNTLISYYQLDIVDVADTEHYGIFIWMIKYLLIIGALIAFSFYLYKKRKPEDISKPFVYSFIYYIFIITAVISIEGFCINNKLQVLGIIISFIMYIILDLIKTRGFKSIKKHAVSFLCYTLSIAAAFSLFTISASSKGFGKHDYVPDESIIKSVTISVGFGDRKGIYDKHLHRCIYKLSEKKSIDQITKMHQTTLDFYNQHSQNIYKYLTKYMNGTYDNTKFIYDELLDLDDYMELKNAQQIDLTYLTIYGDRIQREFYVPRAEWCESMLVLAQYDSMKKIITEDFESFLNIRASTDISNSNHAISVYSKFSETAIANGTHCNDPEVLSEIKECYRKDIMNVTKEDLLNLKTYCYIDDFYIPECFVNTIATLNKYNIVVDKDDIPPYSSNTNIKICKISQINETCLNNGDFNTVPANSPSENFTVTSYDKDCLEALIKVAEPNYYTYEDCYIFSFEDKNYIIPPEYSHIAEEFIESSDYPSDNTKKK